MKATLTTSQAAHMLLNDNNAGWSRNGAYALAEYLEEMESDCGEEMELDVVAIRCDYSEYRSLQEWAEDYFGGPSKAHEELNIGEEPTDEEIDETIREYINDNGQLIEFAGGVIVSSF